MVTSIGLTGADLTPLSVVARIVGQYPVPFIAGADWNIEVRELQDSDWCKEVGAIIVHAGIPTCGDHEFDYFVMSRSPAHFVKTPLAHAGTPAGRHDQVCRPLGQIWHRPTAWVEGPRRPFYSGETGGRGR
eukprot:9310003-Pyramimonas_sp.AAC.1